MAKWTVTVNELTCIGCQSCAEQAPKSFRMRDDNIAEYLDPPGDDPDTILLGAQSCPVDAITIVDEEQDKQLWPE